MLVFHGVCHVTLRLTSGVPMSCCHDPVPACALHPGQQGPLPCGPPPLPRPQPSLTHFSRQWPCLALGPSTWDRVALATLRTTFLRQNKPNPVGGAVVNVRRQQVRLLPHSFCKVCSSHLSCDLMTVHILWITEGEWTLQIRKDRENLVIPHE